MERLLRILGLSFLVWSTGIAGAHAAKGKLQVTATIAPLACFAENVGGEDVEVTLLLNGSAGPHEYQARPRDALVIAKSRIVVENGLGLERFLEKLVANAGSSGLKVIAAGEAVPHELLLGSDDDDHGHGSFNPHVWLDPLLARKEVEVIRDTCVSADPAHAEGYRRRAESYLQKLDALHREFEEGLNGVAAPLFTYHSAYEYLARRYGLRIAAVFSANHGVQPTPRDMKRFLTLISEQHIRVLLAEPQAQDKLFSTLAQDAGVLILTLDPMDVGTSGPDYYERVMRNNLAVLRKATGLEPL